ncbi:hypothetical protein KKC91_11920 [bacterium]|nr:hypothetical protein [bacterium]MBU1852669.1 hypothetical protein [Candidatus Omnitrophota bacterium]
MILIFEEDVAAKFTLPIAEQVPYERLKILICPYGARSAAILVLKNV